MIIKEIELRDFRNYESLALQFHNKVNIFLGENAQGKTNILEAIYLTALGRSFRTHEDSEMIKFGSEFARASVCAEKEDDEFSVEMTVTENGKIAKVNGVKLKKISEILENIYAVIFSPEDLKIVKEDPDKRRRFINTELCIISPAYYMSLSSYKRALKQRNALLKDAKMFNGAVDEKILDIWDEQLASYGSEIMIKRREFIKKLEKISSELHSNITEGREKLSIIYEPNIESAEDPKEQKEIFRKSLAAGRESDIKSGTTGRGPHRDDMCIIVNDTDIRKFGSQGQQRTAALSLKLAEIKLIREETGENAILLLDDVMSELDNRRQNFLVNSLGDVQLFITTTELTEEVKKALPEGKTFKIENGKVYA